MKTLEEYKQRRSALWKRGTGYRAVIVLYFNEQGLKKDELQKLTELNDSTFQNSLESLIDSKDIKFEETSNEKIYSLPENIRKTICDLDNLK